MSKQKTFAAPLAGDDIQYLFRNRKQGPFKINVTKSLEQLAPQQLLVYLTNLNLDLVFEFTTIEEYKILLRTYLQSPMLHKFTQLERGVIELLQQIKGIASESQVDYDDVIRDESLRDCLYRWLSLCESLSIYALRFTEAAQDIESFPKDTSTDLTGINFVKLIGHSDFALILTHEHPERLRYYTHFFDERIYQGSTLENYWCNHDNALYLMSQAMDQNLIDWDVFNLHLQADMKEYVESHQDADNRAQ